MFFQFTPIENISNILIDIGGLIVCFFTLALFLFKSPSIKYNSFSKSFIFFGLAIVFSSLSSYLIWNQSFYVSLTTLIPYLYLLFYFNLKYLKPDEKFIYNLIHTLAFLYALFYLINFVSHPIQFFGYKDFKEAYEIIIKSRFPGRAFMYVSLIILFEKLLYNFKLKNLLLIIFYFIIFILMGRRVMLLSLLISLIYLLLQMNRLKIRTLLTTSFLFLIMFFIVNKYFPILINNIFEVTNQQIDQGNEYVRYLSAFFYLGEFSPHPMSYFFGNGIPSMRSEYGTYVKYIEENYRYFLADIGLLGFYVKTGVFGFLFMISMFLQFWKSSSFNTYLFRCFTVFFIPMSIMNVEIVKPDIFILYAILMYLYEIKRFKLISQIKNNELSN